MRAAVIKDGIVVNIIVADANVDLAPDSCSLMNVGDDADIQVGATFDGVSFTSPPALPAAVIVPQVVSRRQARLLLLQQGLLDQVEAMIALQDRATQITWADAIEFKRNDPLLLALAAAPELNLTSEQLDQFFIAAAQL